MTLIVQKYGGTSVGSIDLIRAVAGRSPPSARMAPRSSGRSAMAITRSPVTSPRGLRRARAARNGRPPVDGRAGLRSALLAMALQCLRLPGPPRNTAHRWVLTSPMPTNKGRMLSIDYRETSEGVILDAGLVARCCGIPTA